mgnify:CR=1 FL=1
MKNYFLGLKHFCRIINGKIVLKDRVLENYALLYSDVIEGVLPEAKLPDGCEVIDANDNVVDGHHLGGIKEVDLSRKIGFSEGKKIDPLFGFVCPLLLKADGEKMGKTATGTLWVSREKTSSFEFFQAWINSFDEDVERSLAFFTRMEMVDIKNLCKKDIREAKKVLAFEVTKLVHGEEEALNAKKISEELFSNKSVSENMPSTNISKAKLGINIMDLLVETNLVSSKSEARRLIEQNGISINQIKQTDVNKIIELSDFKDSFMS